MSQGSAFGNLHAIFFDHVVNLRDDRERDASRILGSDGKSDRGMQSREALLHRSANFRRDFRKQPLGSAARAENAKVGQFSRQQSLQGSPVLLIAMAQDHSSGAFA